MSDIFSESNAKPQFDSTRSELTPWISGMVVNPIEEVNDVVLNASLTLTGQLYPLNSTEVNVMYDTTVEYEAEAVVCLPLLSFKNPQVHPVSREIQLHGLVLRAVFGEQEA